MEGVGTRTLRGSTAADMVPHHGNLDLEPA